MTEASESGTLPTALDILNALQAMAKDVGAMKHAMGEQRVQNDRIEATQEKIGAAYGEVIESVNKLASDLVDVRSRVTSNEQKIESFVPMRPRLPSFDADRERELKLGDSIRATAVEAQKQTESLRVTAVEAEKQTEHLRITAKEAQAQTAELQVQTPILAQVATRVSHAAQYTAIASAMGAFMAALITGLVQSCQHH